MEKKYHVESIEINSSVSFVNSQYQIRKKYWAESIDICSSTFHSQYHIVRLERRTQW